MVLLRVGNSGSHLQTSFTTHPSRGIITEHIDQLAEKDSNGHSIKALERWETLRELGKGGFGSVDLQVCIQGYRSGELRAVKRLRKPEGEEAKMIRREMGILDSVSPFIPVCLPSPSPRLISSHGFCLPGEGAV